MLTKTFSTLAILSCAVFVLGPAFSSAQTTVTINTQDPIGVIEPEIYGQFVEHLGAGIYDGIWVGPDSEIPNTDGIRDDVFSALSDLDIPVMRWPGGCYADLYHWRDGIGPRNQRTRTVNMAWGGTPESNQFGTHEFFNLAERLGSKTYLNVNLGTGTIEEAADWLEYITLPNGSDLADLRIENGRTDPWKIDYLSIGNETWGCGGHMRPSFYSDLYVQWATGLKTSGEAPKRVISGSHEGNIDYSDTVLDHPNIGDFSDGISLHFYTLPTSDWSDKGDALGFPESEWASTIAQTLIMRPAIKKSLAMIEKHDLGENFGLYVDEWGMWVNGEDGDPALYQQNTIRDAVVAALNFNIFHDYANRIPMTNIAQMVNVLQSMILTDGPEMVLTPTYHVLWMYKPFQGATALPVSFESPQYRQGDIDYPVLSVTAARTSEGDIVMGLVNADPVKSLAVQVPTGGASTATGHLLTGAEIDSHNSFENRNVVKPSAISLSEKHEVFTLDLPPRSVSVIEIGGFD